MLGTSGTSGTYSARTGNLPAKGAWYEYAGWQSTGLNAAAAVPTGIVDRGRTGAAGDVAGIDSCHLNNPSQFECCAQQCVETPLGPWSQCMSGGDHAFNTPAANAVNAKMSYPTMVAPTAYVAAQIILELPLMFVLALSTFGVSGYLMVGMYLPSMLRTLSLFALALWAFEATAQTCAVAFNNPMAGMLLYMGVWFSSFLFCGIMIPQAYVVRN